MPRCCIPPAAGAQALRGAVEYGALKGGQAGKFGGRTVAQFRAAGHHPVAGAGRVHKGRVGMYGYRIGRRRVRGRGPDTGNAQPAHAGLDEPDAVRMQVERVYFAAVAHLLGHGKRFGAGRGACVEHGVARFCADRRRGELGGGALQMKKPVAPGGGLLQGLGKTQENRVGQRARLRGDAVPVPRRAAKADASLQRRVLTRAQMRDRWAVKPSKKACVAAWP